MKLIPTILCGGAGSRLWPVSRELHPKPFIRLTDGQSLLQKAWLRGAVLADVAETLTVTNRELFFKTEDEYREVAAIPDNKDLTNRFILEPFGRNTAPAIAAASLQVAATHGEDACLLVLAADHLIADQAAFAQAVATAMQLTAQGKLVTFGIQPDMPETGYGYIEANIDSPLPLAEEGLGERGAILFYASSKSLIWKKPRNTSPPAATCGTPACFAFRRGSCCARCRNIARQSSKRRARVLPSHVARKARGSANLSLMLL